MRGLCRVRMFPALDTLLEGGILSTHERSLYDARIGKQQQTIIVGGVTMRVRTGTVTAVVGAVGSGKSALLSTVVGELPPLTGTVAIAPHVGYGVRCACYWVSVCVGLVHTLG